MMTRTETIEILEDLRDERDHLASMAARMSMPNEAHEEIIKAGALHEVAMILEQFTDKGYHDILLAAMDRHRAKEAKR